MAYVVTKACLGTKDRSCVEVCPVDCFYDIKKKEYNAMFEVGPAHVDDSESSGKDDNDKDWGMLMIHPDECINCGARGPIYGDPDSAFRAWREGEPDYKRADFKK